MIGFIMVAAVMGALGVACLFLSHVADGARDRNEDGELLWPETDRSWR